MAPDSLVKTSRAAGDANSYRLETTNREFSGTNEDLVKNIDASTIENKIDFFRFIGLEISKVCDINSSTNNNNNNNKNNIITINNNNTDKFCGLQPNPESSLKPSGIMRNCDIPVDIFSCQSKTKRQINKRACQSGDMVDSQKIVEPMRECSVMIIGEKCRVCGKSFKCIKDVQLHVRKKHRRKKPRTKVVLLKIGNEVISRVPIRRKHLKRFYRGDDRTSLNNDETTEISWNEEISQNHEINSERLSTPLIDLEDICDIVDTDSNIKNIMDRDVLLSPLGDRSNVSSNQYHNEDDEDIREVLRITRSPRFGPTINHETPNRTERELLLSDAIREFDRMDNDPMDIIEFVGDEETMRDQCNDVIEDYCWLGDRNLQNRHLDLVENNCSYHIQNDYDIDFSFEGANSFAGELDAKYFENESNSLHSKAYRKENGEIVPDFIDYTQCLEDKHPALGNNNNNSSSVNGNVNELESPFYNEARISEWNKLTHVPNKFNCDIRPRIKRNVDESVLIKEEVMLDELL